MKLVQKLNKIKPDIYRSSIKNFRSFTSWYIMYYLIYLEQIEEGIRGVKVMNYLELIKERY